MRLIPEESKTRLAIEQDELFRVCTIDGSEVRKRASTLTVTEWLRVFIAEVTMDKVANDTAATVLSKMILNVGER